MRLAVALALAAVTAAPIAHAQTVQYRSRGGVEFRAQADTGGVARAEAALKADPDNVQLILALGLAQAAIRQYREAIETFSRGIKIDPTNAMLYRWRGHRYISTGQFDKALADLERGIKIDSTNYGIYYHLGVVHFIRGEFEAAAAAFSQCQRRAPEPNEFAGASDWLWMSLSRAGRKADAQRALAPITDTLKITTATAYWQRLLLYRGLSKPDEVVTAKDTADVQRATLSFGVGNWYLTRGEPAKAREWFEKSVASGGWPGFGFFASEVELGRMKK